MIRLFLSLLAALLFGLSPAVAQDHPTRQMLETILADDFQGDAGGRVKYARILDPVLLKKAGCECGPALEVYFIDSDPIEVVTDWEILGPIGEGPDWIEYRARFTSVAFSVSPDGPVEDLQAPVHFIRRPAPTDQTLTYRFELLSEGWNLADAPRPHVSLDHVLAYLREEETELEEHLKTHPHIVETLQRRQAHLAWLRDYIATLSP